MQSFVLKDFILAGTISGQQPHMGLENYLNVQSGIR
jgi:hypothetical protein